MSALEKKQVGKRKSNWTRKKQNILKKYEKGVEEYI
jgi:hypothetical protein